LVLNQVSLTGNPVPQNIFIQGEKITAIGNAGFQEDHCHLHFSGTTAIPGLINSHDHLDFNCFTPMGEYIYNNYSEWGRHIHHAFNDEIQAVLKIPQALRTEWGMYKNLIAGVTTVVNHGKVLEIENPLIGIYQQSQNLHSVAFEKNWKWKINNPVMISRPCVIHTGEGSDRSSESEIDDLIRFNFLKRDLIGVHAVAMNQQQVKKFKGLVWCPESNKNLLGRQPDIGMLKKHTMIVFGTDSTLTGNWNIWNHLRFARGLELTGSEALYGMVTSGPAKLWKLNSGSLQVGKDADLLVLRNQVVEMSELFETNPEDILLILKKGKIRLFDKSLVTMLDQARVDQSGYSEISIGDTVKYVEGNLDGLVNSIQRYYPEMDFPLSLFSKWQNAGYAESN
jgi:cytosine/adenosine deaminase-related metal-dependent hydrolase